MKKILFILALVFSLAACCTEEEVQNCAKAKNGLSYETCHYLICR